MADGQQQSEQQMSYGMRPMEVPDAHQAAQIEKDAFPTLWPPTAFRREVHNRIARYLVALEVPTLQAQGAVPSSPLATPSSDQGPEPPLFRRVIRIVHRLWSPNDPHTEAPPEFLVGYVGLWLPADEAHITALGVRSSHRGWGIGELLLIGAMSLAFQQESSVATLEVRVSNNVAQSLYRKYGFQDAGIRRGYYTDNREDALIMTTPQIHTPEYLQHFEGLVQAHHERRGWAIRLGEV